MINVKIASSSVRTNQKPHRGSFVFVVPTADIQNLLRIFLIPTSFILPLLTMFLIFEYIYIGIHTHTCLCVSMHFLFQNSILWSCTLAGRWKLHGWHEVRSALCSHGLHINGFSRGWRIPQKASLYRTWTQSFSFSHSQQNCYPDPCAMPQSVSNLEMLSNRKLHVLHQNLPCLIHATWTC